MPGRPVRLEEGRLRLEHRDLVAERLHHAAGAALQTGGVRGQPPGVQQAGMRVDADAQRPAVGDRPGRAGLRSGVGHLRPLGHRWRVAVEVGDQPRAAVDEAGVDLEQPGAGVEHRLAVVAGHDAADADHRQRRSARPGSRPPARARTVSGAPDSPPASAARVRVARDAARPGPGWCWWRSGRPRRRLDARPAACSSASSVRSGASLTKIGTGVARPPSRRASATRAPSSSARVSASCRDRRPGVLGLDTLTAR